MYVTTVRGSESTTNDGFFLWSEPHHPVDYAASVELDVWRAEAGRLVVTPAMLLLALLPLLLVLRLPVEEGRPGSSFQIVATGLFVCSLYTRKLEKKNNIKPT